MSTTPVQIFLIVFEVTLLLGGAGLLVWLSRSAPKERWLIPNRLSFWPITRLEFAVFLFLMFGGGTFGQLATQVFLGKTLSAATDKSGLEIFFYGLGFSGCSIAGWFLFKAMRKQWHADYGAVAPTAEKPAAPLNFFNTISLGALTLLAAMPIVTLCSIGWGAVVRAVGLPEDPQPLIAIFEQTKSPLVLVGMLVVACVLAPIGEELLFRAGIFRFFRQNTSRAAAVIVSGVIFGAVHGNWAGFVPLAALGAVLAMSYEATGDIRVPIIAHALFNFNTVIVVVSGLAKSVS